jgi:hypothetical protein
MKNWPSIFCLLAIAALSGCGGPSPRGTQSQLTNTANITGNWQFSTTATTGSALSIAGSIKQSGVAVTGSLHFDGSSCFDQQTTIAFTGTLTGNNISMTSTMVAGQVVTLAGKVTDTSFAGTYSISGACADGDQGNVSATKIPPITSSLSGTFTAPNHASSFDLSVQVTQGNAASDGTFAITGSVTVSTPCFNSGSLKTAAFPSGSYILGTSVALVIETNNGTLNFGGTMDPVSGEVDGSYAVSGGTCDEAGTAVLKNQDPGTWDY